VSVGEQPSSLFAIQVILKTNPFIVLALLKLTSASHKI